MYDIIMLFGRGNDEGKEDLWIVPIIWAVILVVIGTVVYISRKREKARTAKLAAIFQDLGYPFQADLDPARIEHLSSFPLMNIGHSKKLKNVITVETPQADLAMFDYRYVTGHGKHRKVHQQTVMSVESSVLIQPVFNLYPEGFWSKVGAAFGGQDIDFPEHPDFSTGYVLKGDSEEEIRLYMDMTLLDFFTAQGNICCEAREGAILYYRRRTRVEPDPDQLQHFMEEGMRVMEELVNRQSRPGGQPA